MAKYNLNEELKAREAAESSKSNLNENGEKKLDDITRVKVLSPGRQVFKRFIRNRLAVFGSVTLITLFVFSFIGPLLYPYGQKQIFYKFETEEMNYGLAKENTAYNGYDVSEEKMDSKIVNAMNSNIKSMIAADEDSRLLFAEDGTAYTIEKLGYEVYALGVADSKEICTVGESSIMIGNYNPVQKTIEYKGEEIEGLDEAAAAALGAKAASPSTFEFDGATYVATKESKVSWTIELAADGLNYAGAKLDAAFEKAANAAVEAGEVSFENAGKTYAVVKGKTNSTVYEVGESEVGKVYTRFTLDTFETGGKVSEDFKAQALMNAYTTGKFTADGVDYSIEANDTEELVITTADGREYAEFSLYTVRRYTGEDSMEYDLKKAIVENIEAFSAAGKKEGQLNHRLPLQDAETGLYTYDENGDLQYNDAEIMINQSATGEYVLRAEQVIYKIDIYAAPSGAHLLGTDGDGFDVLARIMYGGRISLIVGFVVIFIETFLGIIMGGLAGYYGGWVDMLIMRMVDIFYCLPSMPIMIILGSMMDALRMNTYVRLIIMMAALGIMGWAGVARLVRGQILSLREQEFMLAAEATGLKVRHRIFRHLVPNVMPQLIVTATMGIGGVIITESTLSFLGLGVKHPLATWGTIINSVSSASAMAHYAFIWIPVGLLICLTVIAFNFVGDGLRDAYDPKAKR